MTGSLLFEPVFGFARHFSDAAVTAPQGFMQALKAHGSRHEDDGAASGNRTRVSCLGSTGIATIRWPPIKALNSMMPDLYRYLASWPLESLRGVETSGAR